MIDGDGKLMLGEAVGWLSGVLLAVLAWFGRQQVTRIDDHDVRLDALDRDAVTRDDLTQMENRITGAVSTGIAHVAERLGDVKATADKAHERIDQMRDRAQEWRT